MINVTLDSATVARLRMIYPDVAVRVRRTIQDMGVCYGRQMRVSEAMRTFAYQGKLYAQGRTTPGPVVTNSKPGDSIHHYGCATDLVFAGADPYLEKLSKTERERLWTGFGKMAAGNGLTWGGDWDKLVDMPHVQLTYGYTLQQIKEFYRQGGLDGVFRALDTKRGVELGQDWYGPQTRIRLLELGDSA